MVTRTINKLLESRGETEALYKPFWTQVSSNHAGWRFPQGPISDVLRHVPESISLELSEHQIAVLNEAMTRRRREKNHKIDYRAEMRWLGRDYYLAVVAGPNTRERPGGMRVLSPRRLVVKVGQLIGLYLMAAAIAVAIMLVLYFLKSIAGIDLFDGPSFLHEFIFN